MAQENDATNDEEADLDWTAVWVRALAALSLDDLPVVESLFLTQLVKTMHPLEPANAYGSEQAAEVLACLQLAVIQAPEIRCEKVPDSSNEIAAYRTAFLAGAHQFADFGEAGLIRLVNRLFPAVAGELEDNRENRELQIEQAFSYSLLALCSGPNDPDPYMPAWLGIRGVLTGWSDILTQR